ncbi:MAG: hypothetical protein QXP59_06235 [Saccharolobus sp.]
MTDIDIYSLSGRVFELGFKVGFLQSLKQSNKYMRFFDNGKNTIENIESKINSYLNAVSDKTHGKIIYDLKEKLILDKKADVSLYEQLKSMVNMDECSDETILIGHYVVGWHSGYEFGKDFRDKTFKGRYNESIKESIQSTFFMFDISQETNDKGTWRNADMIIYRDKTLHVYDIKSSNGVNVMRKFYSNHKITLPPVISGFNLYLSFGNGCESFVEFIDNFERIVQDKDRTQGLDLIYISQVFSYLFDFLRSVWMYNKESYEIDYISVGTINPFLDNSIYRWNVSGCLTDEIIKKGQIFKDVYKNLHYGAVFTKKEVIESIKQNYIKYVIDKIEKSTNEYKEQISKLENNCITLTPKNSIDDVRKEVSDVVKKVKDEFLSSNQSMVVCLFHSAGTGKTTAIIREFLENNDDKRILMIGVWPRIELKKDVVEKHVKPLKNTFISSYVGDKIFYASKIEIDKDHQKIKDAPGSKGSGNIKSAVKALEKDITEHPNKHIFVDLTTQSWVKIETEYYSHHTHTNLENFLNDINIGERKIIIVLDEVLGSENGIDTLLKLIRTINNLKYQNKDINILLLVLDMNLHSKNVLEKLLKEYEYSNFLAPSLHIVDRNNEDDIQGEFTYYGVPIKVYSGYTFPAKSIQYKCRFVREGKKNNSDLFDVIKQYIDSTDANDKVFIYIQNRSIIDNLRSHLIRNGYRTAFVTSLKKSKEFKDSEEGLRYDNKKVIISTSSLSRGVSLGNEVKRTIIVNTGMRLGVEGFLAEELQALARMRGGDDNVEKDIIRIVYYDKENNDDDIDLKSMLVSLLNGGITDQDINNLSDDDIERLLHVINEYNIYSSMYAYEVLARNVLATFIGAKEYKNTIGIVPIPTQYETTYNPSTLGTVQSIMKELPSLTNEYKHGLVNEKDRDALYAFQNILKDLYNKVIAEMKPNNGKDNLDDKNKRKGYCIYETNIRAIQNSEKHSSLQSILDKVISILKKTEIVRESFISQLEELKKKLIYHELLEDEVSYVYMPLYAFVQDMMPIGKQILVNVNKYLGRMRFRHKYDNVVVDKDISVGISQDGTTYMVFPLDNNQWRYLFANYPVFPKEFVFELINHKA